jgi:malonyl-CoA O-methyltransferase
MFSRIVHGVRRLREGGGVTLNVREAYALWAKEYAAEPHNPFMRIEQQAMLELVPEVAGKTVLDVGCGSGRYLKILRERGARLAVGIDLSAEMLGRARGLFPIACADVRALPVQSRRFDVVVSALTLGHVADLAAALAEIGRALVAGGVLLYSDFHPFAAVSGFQRRFSVGGRTFVIEHHAHLYGDHHAACRAAGLEIDDVREPMSPSEHPFPAVLVVRAHRR